MQRGPARCRPDQVGERPIDRPDGGDRENQAREPPDHQTDDGPLVGHLGPALDHRRQDAAQDRRGPIISGIAERPPGQVRERCRRGQTWRGGESNEQER